MRFGVIVSLLLLVAAMMVGVGTPGCRKPSPAPPPPAPPAPAATTQAASAPAVVGDYLALLRIDYPEYPATQPLADSATLDQAGHFVLDQNVYLDERGQLWITHPDADDFPNVLVKDFEQQVYIVRLPVRFAVWRDNDNGTPRPLLICEDPATGKMQWIDADDRSPVAETDVDWGRASYWTAAGKVVAPTRDGVILYSLTASLGDIQAERFDFPELKSVAHAPVQILHDNRGLLVWVPPLDKMPGSRGAVRYLDGKFIPLGPKQHWPERIVHLIPLLDGSVTQIYRDADGSAKLGMTVLDTATVDEAQINVLINQLYNPKEEKRKAAFEQLGQYGPGIWPILEQRVGHLPAEARLSVEDLLANKSDPRLGGMALVDGNLQVISRLSDGGVIFYARSGVTLPSMDPDQAEGAQDTVTAPAWIAVCPGEPVRLLDQALVQSLKPERARISQAGGKWIVADDALGPQRYSPPSLDALLRKSERGFTETVGVDGHGRWIFQTPTSAPTTEPATEPTALAGTPRTLILDPTLPDAKAHLPVWVVPSPDGESGWDAHNWPVVQHSGTWAVIEFKWRLLDKEAGEKIIADAATVAEADLIVPPTPTTTPTTSPATSTRPATVPATDATTGATTAPANDASDHPLLVDADGTRYYDGLTAIRIVWRGGETTTWPLPDKAAGAGKPRLIKTREGSFFLFNSGARVVKLRPTPNEPAPFAVDGVFTHHIPNADTATRIWLDPADRIDVAYEQDGEHFIAILFTSGRIPLTVQTLMPASEEPEPDE